MLLTALAVLSSFSGLHTALPSIENEATLNTSTSGDVVFIAPFGIAIPVDHRGMAFMIDVPDVAIEIFEPDADIELDSLAVVSQTYELTAVELARTGQIIGVTLDLPELAWTMPGETAVKYLVIRPDGSFEFVPAAAAESGCRLIISVNILTGKTEVRCAVTDCAGVCELLIAVQPDGTATFRCACLESPPE